MKRTGYVLAILALATFASAQETSLADAARLHKQQQTGKPTAAKVFTNDDLPTTETISTVGATPVENTATPVANDNNGSDGSQAAAAAPKTDDPAKDKKKSWEDWQKKIEAQKASVAQMQKDNDEVERQYKLTTGNFYNSAQQRVYDGAAMAKEDAAYKEQMEKKRNAIVDAKQKVDDMEENARKAGVPAGYRD